MSIPSVMPSSRLILWCPLLLPSIFSSIRDFSSEPAACIRWPKQWSFSFSVSSFNKYSGLIFLKSDWFDLAVQGTFQESSPAPQFKGINSLAFCLLYSPALTTTCYHWEDHSLEDMDSGSRVLSLLFNTLSSRFILLKIRRINFNFCRYFKLSKNSLMTDSWLE